MKATPLFLFICIATSTAVQAQTLHGIVLDKQTGLPVKEARVEQLYSTHTSEKGTFNLPLNMMMDYINIFAYGYQVRKVIIRDHNLSDTLTIYLQPLSSQLDEVVIRSGRNYKLDSIANRNQFGKEFNYKGPKVTDAFKQYKSPYEAPSLSISVFTLVGALTKKRSQEYKFQQKLLSYEQEGYIDNKFNEDLVISVTKLRGDSLQIFMRKYRPVKSFLQNISEYDLMTYIKDCYTKFVASTP